MANSHEKVVVIGSGQAGIELAVALRARGHTGSISIIGDDPEFPYQRPPLSKHLLESATDTPMPLHGGPVFRDKDIDLRLGAAATGIDRERKAVGLSSGERVPYDHLVLATGARNRLPNLAGLHRDRVLGLRTLADARRLFNVLADLRHVAIIGGGFIGLELAALLRERGIAVDVVERASRLMSRSLSAAASDHLLEFHRALGTRIHLDTEISGLTYTSRGTSLRLNEAEVLHVDQVIMAAGVQPNTELADEAGLAVGNGVLVDATMATEDPAISAIGDCAAHPNPFAGETIIRLESVQNAADQARTLAARLTGNPHPYKAVPWFWSNQRDLKLQIAGLCLGHDDTVVRGDKASGRYSLFLFSGHRLAAVESFNTPRDHMVSRKLIEAGVPVPKKLVADSEFDLTGLMPSRR
ncbi:NAD(P)/FAD-dependent oxidoreductase [Nocardia sp. NPDC055049]